MLSHFGEATLQIFKILSPIADQLTSLFESKNSEEEKSRYERLESTLMRLLPAMRMLTYNYVKENLGLNPDEVDSETVRNGLKAGGKIDIKELIDQLCNLAAGSDTITPIVILQKPSN